MTPNVDLTELAIDRGGANGPSVRTRRHMLTRYVLPLVLVLGFLSLVAWASRDFVFPPKPVTVMPVYATTAEFRQEGTPLFNAAGWIEPRPTPVRVVALAPGVVEKLLVVEDQSVEAGEAVAELVKDDAKLAFDRATADRDLRKAELDEARALLKAAETRFNQPVHLEAMLRSAEASLARIEKGLRGLPFEVRRAEADLDAAQKDYDGKRAAKGVVKRVEIDIAKSARESASALVAELRDRDESLRKEQTALTGQRDAVKTQFELRADETEALEQSQAKVQAALARVEQARVVVEEAQLQLNRMTIVAPVDGRVFRLIAHPGARIGAGMTQMSGHDGSTVVTMYRPQMLQVRVDVRFEDLPNVSPDQPVMINNPALPSPLKGKVLFASSEADIQKNTLQVKVAIPDPPSVFKPEMLVDVTFLAPKRPERTSAPTQEVRLYVLQQLVLQGDGGPFVWLADQSDGVACRTAVQTGMAGSNGLVEVTSGLRVSSRLIVRGIDGLQNGDRIKVTKEDTSLNGRSGHGTGTQSETPNRPRGDNQ